MMIVPPSRWDLVSVGANLTVSLPLVMNIDARGAREVIVAARFHSSQFAGTGNEPTIVFGLVDIAPFPDGRVWTSSSIVAQAGPGQTTVPNDGNLYVGSNSTPFGSTLALFLLYTQYQTTVTDAEFIASVDISFKR